MQHEPKETESLPVLGRRTGLVSFFLTYSRLLRFLFIILLGRAIGPSSFGVYASMVALILIAAPLSTFGYQHLFVQHLARKQPVPSPLFTTGFLLTVGSALGFGGLGAWGFRSFIHLPLPIGVIFLFLAAEIWVNGTRELFKGIFQGTHEFSKLSFTVFVAVPSLRILTLVGLMLLNPPVTLTKVIVFLEPLQILLMVGLFLLYIPKNLFAVGLDLHRVREGIYFSVATVSNEVYGNVDKLMLSKLSTLNMVGFYTIAFRMIRYLYIPVTAALTVMYPLFFHRGQFGIRKTLQLGFRAAWITLAYALLIVGGIFVSASWIVRTIFGAAFLPATGLMKVMSLILIFQAFSLVVGDALTGAGYQKQRTYFLLVTVAVNFGLNLLLIPLYGAFGAAWASVFSEALLSGLIVGFALRNRVHSTLADPHQAPPS